MKDNLIAQKPPKPPKPPFFFSFVFCGKWRQKKKLTLKEPQLMLREAQNTEGKVTQVLHNSKKMSNFAR